MIQSVTTDAFVIKKLSEGAGELMCLSPLLLLVLLLYQYLHSRPDAAWSVL